MSYSSIPMFDMDMSTTPRLLCKVMVLYVIDPHPIHPMPFSGFLDICFVCLFWITPYLIVPRRTC